ncbi:beta-1 3-galactosyltransferase 1 [Biomphalaria pfeifferi]|uniref:Hexosyltransferase n=1 Tax=Biomphalaria pfeifferi TaxID=112525 RepID=A0AAD8C5F7_BIOPF|nr:beta-1 3-galactosyltransferase 1 [Biomphalaria pfeifferi]
MITVLFNLVVYDLLNAIIIANQNTTSITSPSFSSRFKRIRFSANYVETNDSKLRTTVTELSTTSTPPTQNPVQENYPLFIINNHRFLYKIVPKVNCLDSKLVICVEISRTSNMTRQTIRQTWGSYANVSSNNSTLIFFLGSEHPSTNGSQSVQQFIDKEAELYGDILQEDYVDDYKNLSLKSVSILKWVSLKCPESHFLLKVDDDMYVNVPVLVQTLDDLSKSKGKEYPFIVGYAVQGTGPIRNPNSKWYASISEYKGNSYPRYASGVSYAMTTSAAKLLYNASLQVPVFWLEDVYVTGILAEKVKVEVIHNPLINIGKHEVSGCHFRNKISGHHYSASDMESIYKELYNTTIKCN